MYVNTSRAQQINQNQINNQPSIGDTNTSAQKANIDINNAIITLVTVLQSDNPETRINAARAIGGLGSYGKIATPALIAALKDKDHRVRYSAAIALTNIGEQPQANLPLLIEALQDSSKLISSDAVNAIVNAGYTLNQKSSKLSTPDIKQILSYFDKVLLHLQKSTTNTSPTSISTIRTYRNLLEEEIKRR
ncbi:MAG: HEAT repeat domain-containing protein [Cyanobacteria bacterium P01_A01_bin.84]